MGLFAHRPEEKTAWAALPGEPQEREGSVDALPDAGVDPLGLGLIESTTSVSIPVIPPAAAPGL